MPAGGTAAQGLVRPYKAYQAEQFRQFDGSGLKALERLKKDGRDPTHGGSAAKKRGSSNVKRNNGSCGMGRPLRQTRRPLRLQPPNPAVDPGRAAQPARQSDRAVAALLLPNSPWREDTTPPPLECIRSSRPRLTVEDLGRVEIAIVWSAAMARTSDAGNQ